MVRESSMYGEELQEGSGFGTTRKEDQFQYSGSNSHSHDPKDQEQEHEHKVSEMRRKKGGRGGSQGVDPFLV